MHGIFPRGLERRLRTSQGGNLKLGSGFQGAAMVRRSSSAEEASSDRCVSNSVDTTDSHSAPAEIHVLAVDDNNIDRKLIEVLLKNSSFKVTTVNSPLKALEVLGLGKSGSPTNSKGFQVDLVITDYCMPEMTGYELLKRVKGSSALKEIPVVIISSENVPYRINRCMAEGAEEFLIKPVQLADVRRLRGHVRQAMSLSASSSENSSGSSPCSSKRKVSATKSVQTQQSRKSLYLQNLERRPRLNRQLEESAEDGIT
ncbi:hypothetical protein R1flu_007863 [Riccia fluitans]|uniref:Response regulatory domain-containing protein n=1 Tax=Riccia fluitans TaxID=41844 RepID=A0ABD1Z2P3_9MARC